MNGEAPDFETLRRERNEAATAMIAEMGRKLGATDPSAVRHNFDFDACYCACPDGPCEHSFGGWREFDDNAGGETICQRCGIGAMSHSLRTAP